MIKKRVLFLQIEYSKVAVKFLHKQNRQTQIRIISAIEKIPQGDIKKLQGQQNFRLRVGNYRILFNKNGTIINIFDIDNRGQIYK